MIIEVNEDENTHEAQPDPGAGLALALGLVGFSALADGTLIIGEVTVTSRYASNLRSGPGTNYPVVGNANPGQVFRTTGMSGDFYELLMPDNSTAYLHKNLGRYTAYPTPIPLGTQYTIPVYYRTSTGQNLLTTSQAVRIGQNTITANDALVPGYRLVSTRNVYVTVDATGRAFPNGVVFLYEHSYVPPVTPTPAPVQSYATVPVLYKNVYGQQLASEYRQLLPGTHLVQADSSRVPYGYVLSGVTDAVVFVSYAGVANPSSVSFVVIQQSYTPTPTPRPAVYATIPVIYRDGGSILYSTNQTLGEGYTTITANDSRVPSGYILTSARSVSVYVNASGVATPSSVTFTYRRPVTASIEVVYQAGGNTFHTGPEPSARAQTPSPPMTTWCPGYVLQGQRSVVVTVNPDGSVEPGHLHPMRRRHPGDGEHPRHLQGPPGQPVLPDHRFRVLLCRPPPTACGRTTARLRPTTSSPPRPPSPSGSAAAAWPPRPRWCSPTVTGPPSSPSPPLTIISPCAWRASRSTPAPAPTTIRQVAPWCQAAAAESMAARATDGS